MRNRINKVINSQIHHWALKIHMVECAIQTDIRIRIFLSPS